VGEAGEVEAGTKTTAYTHTQHVSKQARSTRWTDVGLLCTGYTGQRRASVRRKKELCWERQWERGWVGEGGRKQEVQGTDVSVGEVCTPHPPPRLSEHDGDGGFLIAK
jgi:hypothetical protein